MALLSGKDGTVRLAGGELLRVSQWRIEKTSHNKSYAANDTGGARMRVPGVKDCTGRLEIKADDAAAAPVGEGDVLALELHADDSAENYYELSAIVDAVRVEVDVAQARPVAYLVAFSGNGPITAHGILNEA